MQGSIVAVYEGQTFEVFCGMCLWHVDAERLPPPQLPASHVGPADGGLGRQIVSGRPIHEDTISVTTMWGEPPADSAAAQQERVLAKEALIVIGSELVSSSDHCWGHIHLLALRPPTAPAAAATTPGAAGALGASTSASAVASAGGDAADRGEGSGGGAAADPTAATSGAAAAAAPAAAASASAAADEWSFSLVTKLKVPSEVGAVVAYDDSLLMAAIGPRLVALRLQAGTLRKVCWAATRETCASISTCAARGVVAAADKQHSVTLWAYSEQGGMSAALQARASETCTAQCIRLGCNGLLADDRVHRCTLYAACLIIVFVVAV